MTAAVLSNTCPDWCDGRSHQSTGRGPALPGIHAQASTYAAARLGDWGDTYLALGLVRDDVIDGQPIRIGIALNDGFLAEGCGYEDELQLTTAQARYLAATLNRLADEGEAR